MVHRPLSRLGIDTLKDRFAHSWSERTKRLSWRPSRRKSFSYTSENTIGVRLAGVDAPECSHFGAVGQPYGPEALQWLKKLAIPLFCAYIKSLFFPLIVSRSLPPRSLPFETTLSPSSMLLYFSATRSLSSLLNDLFLSKPTPISHVLHHSHYCSVARALLFTLLYIMTVTVLTDPSLMLMVRNVTFRELTGRVVRVKLLRRDQYGRAVS